ncbi:MAG: RnfABCDGE type electron transport complex subunit D [Gammaproteobacteria bacterium]
MKTPAIMWTVAAALLPALAAAVVGRGIGALWQAFSAVCACLLFEFICLRWRGLPGKTLADGSAAVAGLILGLALPPLAPWYVAPVAAGFAMALAKHCYGGLGNNPFNPAMAGYALAFLSFPAAFGGWGAAESWREIFAASDAASMPTPLIAARLGMEAPPPSYLFPAACVLGGAVLLQRRVADWRLPAAFIGGVLAAGGGDISALFAGGMMLAAFFVITDPATAAETPGGRIVYGFAAGALAVLLRERGQHADGIAFAVLFCNMLAPLADRAAGAVWRRR